MEEGGEGDDGDRAVGIGRRRRKEGRNFNPLDDPERGERREILNIRTSRKPGLRRSAREEASVPPNFCGLFS